MISYFKMKRNEWKVKAMLYGTVLNFWESRKDMTELAQRLYTALKDIPADELRKELISKIAELVHEQTVKENQKEA